MSPAFPVKTPMVHLAKCTWSEHFEFFEVIKFLPLNSGFQTIPDNRYNTTIESPSDDGKAALPTINSVDIGPQFDELHNDLWDQTLVRVVQETLLAYVRKGNNYSVQKYYTWLVQHAAFLKTRLQRKWINMLAKQILIPLKISET